MTKYTFEGTRSQFDKIQADSPEIWWCVECAKQFDFYELGSMGLMRGVHWLDEEQTAWHPVISKIPYN